MCCMRYFFTVKVKDCTVKFREPSSMFLPEITGDSVFTLHLVLAYCTLWLLGLNRKAARAQPCGNTHRGSRDFRENRYPAGYS